MSAISGCIRKWLLCCFPQADTDAWSVEESSRSAKEEEKELVQLAPISISVSTGLLTHGPGLPSPTPTVSFTATTTSSSSTVPSSSVPPSCPSAHSHADRASNVVDVSHLIADLMLDGTRPAAGGAAHHEGNLVASLELLQGCCRRSIPQPADSDYRRDLSSNTNPITRLLPASYPVHRLPQLEDPNFLHHHIDPLQPAGEAQATTSNHYPSPADLSDWWYQSEDNFTLFANQF
ncbi:hypothetical protein BSKO_09702 [Bryopsis sp. KO-2023]|nr:hypothetical protein BSKO_09702 [Bryopsis sp. KO-2023]